METSDNHASSIVSGLVMLAAILTTYTTYSYYNDEKLAANYEADQAAMEQTASALMSVRLAQPEVPAATSTATTTQKETKTQ